MAVQGYSEYLAARIIAENQPVTYRLLSRALKTNVNLAKQMLYEFHTKQNARKPKSVHATYILTGKKRTLEQANGFFEKDSHDTDMRSSPYMSQLSEPEEIQEDAIKKTSIILVREEELEKTKADYEQITSIHIYSLEPGPLEDLHVLSVCNEKIATEGAAVDPLERWTSYGSIQNSYIKRRTTKYIPAAPKAAVKPAVKQEVVGGKKSEIPALTRTGSASEDSISGRATPQQVPAALKRSDSKSKLKKNNSVGDLFKSFAKAKPKAKEATKPEKPDEDDIMQGMSEDEDDGQDEPEVKVDEEKAAAARKAREERDEKNRQMMEADIEMPDASPKEESESQNAESQEIVSALVEELEIPRSAQPGRRRVRRRVPKKRTVQDEDGYLVTKEEMVYESFSEDEPEPKKPKATPKPIANVVKDKKKGPRNQGSIANFFKKT